MSAMTEKMSKAGSGRAATTEHHGHGPKKGEQFRCDVCGMELQITKNCKCEDPDHVHFHCCGQEMTHV